MMKVVENKKTVKIKLTTTIKHSEEESETFELWVEGFLQEKKDQQYLSYVEVQDSGEVRTVVRMGEKEGLVLRGGAINMRLPFAVRELRMGSYDGGFGSLPISVKTQSMQFKPEAGKYTVNYELFTNDQSIGEYKLQFTYTEVEQ